jgi:hypothetical protein
MVFSSLTLARGMITPAAFLRFKRNSHPCTSLDRRRRYATIVIEHQPQLRIEIAPLPGLGNLHQTAQAQSVGLFFTLFAIEHRAGIRGYGMYRASIFGGQEPAGAIRPSGRDERPNADQPAPGVNNRARAGKEIVQCEPRQIGFIQVLSDPMEVCRDQASRDEVTVGHTGSAIAHRSRNTEFGSFDRHFLSFLRRENE